MNKIKRKFKRRMKYNYKRTFFGMFLFLLFISFGVGYAFLSTNLSIDGTSNISGARWNIHFANIDVNEGSVSATSAATITNPTTINFSLVLNDPGDFYEFTVDIVNEGTLDARISDLSFLPVLTEEQQRYYDYSINYVSGSNLAIGDGLKAGTSEKIKVRFEYKVLDDETLYPEEDDEISPSIHIEYEQGDGTQPNILNEPTFSETPIIEGIKTVTIDYHVNCGSGYVCKYVVNDGEEVIVNTRTVELPFTSTGVINATISNDSGSLNNGYVVKYNRVYVKSDGNDETGFGTISKPYSSISRAYLMTEDTATIFVMDDIAIDTETEIENGKKITLTSCTRVNNTECNYNYANNVERIDSYQDAFFHISSGELNLQDISIHGAGTQSTMAMINNFNGTLNVNEGAVISGGNNSQGGGAIYSEGSTININDGQIESNSAVAGGAMFIKTTTVNMNDGFISNNNTSGAAGGIYADTQSTFNLVGGSIDGNSAVTGGGIYITNQSIFNIMDGVVARNHSSSGGGGVYVNDRATLNLKTSGASISNNESDLGAGVFVYNGIVNMDNGSISSNTSTGGGGGLWNDSRGTLNLSGGVINNNKVTGNGVGGGAIENSGNVNIKGVTISDNITSTHNGGAIWSRGGTITMTSGLITGNTARAGGAIMLTGYEENSIKMIFSGGTISNNTATSGNGGGIMLLKYTDYSAPILTMSGDATISGNTSSGYGGGICSTQSIINMNGGIVKKNTSGSSGGGIYSSGSYNYTSGYICKNNNPTNSYDITAATDSHCT